MNMPVDLECPVLVVDDFLEMRGTMRLCLEELGFTQIFEAESIKAARTLLSIREYALILADWQMPESNGIGLLRTVRASIIHRNVPFIIVTAYASKDLVLEAKTLNVSGFIAKPFDLSSIAKAIEDIP